MKNVTLSSIFTLLLSILSIAFSQAQITPQAINYQAVIRKSSGEELANGTEVNLRISILDGKQFLYTETHEKVVTKFGLYNVLIGKGVSTDDFSQIRWGNGLEKNIKVQTDTNKDGIYDIESNSQLISVPYALFAEAAVERQRLKISGNKLSILNQEGKELNSVDLPSGGSGGVSYTAGDGIIVTSGTIINSKPDKTVEIQGTGGIVVSGTYPNFTIFGDKFTAGSGIKLVSKGSGAYEITSNVGLSLSSAGVLSILPNSNATVTLPTGGGTTSKQWSYDGDEYRFTNGTASYLKEKALRLDDELYIEKDGIVRFDLWGASSGSYITGNNELGKPKFYLGAFGNYGYLNTKNADGDNACYIGILGDTKEKNGYMGVNLHTCPNGSYSVVTMYKDKNSRGALQVSNDDCTGFFGAAMYFDDTNYTPGKWVVTAQVKSYKEDHPTDNTKDVWNASIEGDEVAQYTRGTATLKNGRVTIQLPEIYSLMVEEGTMTVQITPNDEESLGLCVKNKTTKGFEVVELHRGKGNYSFDYEVKAVRKGYKNFKVIRDKEKMPSAAMPNDINNLKNERR